MTALGTTIARMRRHAESHPRAAHLSVSRWIGVPLLWVASMLLGGVHP